MRAVFLFLGLILTFGFSQAKNLDWEYSKTQKAVVQDYRNFLIGIGFEDFSDRANEAFKRIENDDKVSIQRKKTLEENAERFAIIDHSREMAVLAMAGLESLSDNEKTVHIEALTNLATYFLLPFPMNGLEGFPKEKIYKGYTGPKAKELRDEYIWTRVQARYKEEKELVMATYLSLLNSGKNISNFLTDKKNKKINKQIELLDEHISELINYRYEWSGLAQTRYFGRALGAALVRYSRLHQQKQIENNIRSKLAERGEYLDNFITSNLTFKDRQGKAHKVQVFNGDVINEYSTGAEGAHISTGVFPTTAENAGQAKKFDMIIPTTRTLMRFLSDGQMERAQKKLKENLDLDHDEEYILSAVWDPYYVKGFSHAGFVEVHKDQKSGIEMVWVWDVYPWGDFGGVRRQGFENFAYPERYNRIGFVHYDPVKTLKAYQEQINKKGFQKVVWESAGSYVEVINDTKPKGRIAVTKKKRDSALAQEEEADPDYIFHKDESRKYQWLTTIDQDTVNRWMSYTEKDAENWYFNEFVPRVQRAARDFFMTEEAVRFSSGFKNMEGNLYCSQFVLLAYLRGTGFDLQPTPDKWNPFVVTITKLGLSANEINERIISPNGFAWQKNLVQNYASIDLDRSRVVQQKINHPELNGQKTIADQNLDLLRSSKRIKGIAKELTDIELTLIDKDFADLDDDDY